MTRKTRKSGEAVRELRDAQVLSRRELGEETGLSEHTIMRIETKDDYNPRRKTLLALADYFGVPLQALLENGNDPLPGDSRSSARDDPQTAHHRTG